MEFLEEKITDNSGIYTLQHGNVRADPPMNGLATIHRFPFPTGWLSLPLYTAGTINDDRWYIPNRPLYSYQKDIIGYNWATLFRL